MSEEASDPNNLNETASYFSLHNLGIRLMCIAHKDYLEMLEILVPSKSYEKTVDQSRLPFLNINGLELGKSTHNPLGSWYESVSLDMVNPTHDQWERVSAYFDEFNDFLVKHRYTMSIRQRIDHNALSGLVNCLNDIDDDSELSCVSYAFDLSCSSVLCKTGNNSNDVPKPKRALMYENVVLTVGYVNPDLAQFRAKAAKHLNEYMFSLVKPRIHQ